MNFFLGEENIHPKKWIEFKYVKNLSEIAKIKQNKSNNGPKKG